MGQHRVVRSRLRRSWRWLHVIAVALALVVVGVGGGVWWWGAAESEPAGGTPRLVVDREVIDFGYVPFDKSVTATFTLRNTGDGVLRLAEVPRVAVVAGC